MKPIRIELPTDFAVGTVNAFLFTQPEPVLVDTGVKSDASWGALQAGLADQGFTITDLARVIITHPHVDHFGQAGRMATQFDIPVWVSELGAAWLLDFPAMWQKRLDYYRDEFLKHVGFPPGTVEAILDFMAATMTVCDSVPVGQLKIFSTDATLQIGGLSWQVVHTPGHASHQTCFYQPETRQFLAADMLLAKAPTPIVERPLEGSQRVPSLPQFLDSLTLVESLDIDTVYPGHGEVFGDHRSLIERQRARINKRKAECLELIGSGEVTVAQLVANMYAHLPTHFHFAGLWMLVGYLDLLKADGLISEKEIDGVWCYQAKRR